MAAGWSGLAGPWLVLAGDARSGRCWDWYQWRGGSSGYAAGWCGYRPCRECEGEAAGVACHWYHGLWCRDARGRVP